MRSRWRMLLIPVLAVAMFGGCHRSGGSAPPQTMHAFTPNELPITKSGVSIAEGGWVIERDAAGSVPLFEVQAPGLERTALTYRARLKASDVRGKAYLEMWVRVPGRGEFFSRGIDQALRGSSDWASYEIPFFLNELGVRADLVKLNVAFEGGGGAVWIKDVELLKAPLG